MGKAISRTSEKKVGEVGMRLIDADDLAAKIMMEAPDFMDGGSTITKAFILAMIKTRSATPTIDAVPVVRCKDCIKGERWNNCIVCKSGAHDPNWFCADGERSEGR